MQDALGVLKNTYSGLKQILVVYRGRPGYKKNIGGSGKQYPHIYALPGRSFQIPEEGSIRYKIGVGDPEPGVAAGNAV
jgi:hypothetical protein